MQLDEFAIHFVKDYLMISFLSTSTTIRSELFMYSGASRHMTEAWHLFSSLMDKDLKVHVEYGDDARYAMKGEGIVTFHLIQEVC
jgi:hypothetical protein